MSEGITMGGRQSRRLRTARVPSPVGVLHVAVRDGALVGITLSRPAAMKRQVEGATGGTTAGTDSSVRQSRATDVGATDVVLMEAVHQLRAYFAGELRQFDVPLRAAGTPFQRAVWEALRTVPYGERVSYAEIARLIGRPSAARAVGRAIGDNPIAIIVPCHRVVGFNGQLTGYAGGLAAKAQLLSLESRVVASAATRR